MNPTPSRSREFCPCCGRREFLATSFAASAALMLARLTGRAADTPASPAGATPNPITDVIAFAATPLPLSAVRLTGGPLKVAQDLDANHLKMLDMDRLMYRIRERAGLQPKTDNGYGSWEGPGRQLTGAMAGHYLSAVSYMFAATGDSEFKRRTDYMVNEYKEVQDAHGDGYFGGLMANLPRGAQVVDGQLQLNGKSYPVFGPPSAAAQNNNPNAPSNGVRVQSAIDGKVMFQVIADGVINSSAFDLNGMWSPWYVQHKLMAGLRDAYRQTGNRAALDVMAKHAAWIDSIVGNLTDAQIQRMLGTEFGGINESLADLYADTGDKRWLTLSQKFHHDAMVNPLAAGNDILSGKHGNTNVPKLLGELARYIYAGNKPDGDAAKFFWDAVVYHHSFATGGHGYDEAFGPADQLSAMVDGSYVAPGNRNPSHDTRTCESCNVYNMIKFSRLLFALNPDNKYAEFHERALLNHVLASINYNDGQVCYMVSVGRGVTHEYQGLDGMTCCSGTGLESHGLHGLGLYYTAADKLWVNIYTPSTAQWKEQGVAFAMDADSSSGDSATLKFTETPGKEFSLMLRYPSWSGGAQVFINGEQFIFKDAPKPGSYMELRRGWKAGDSVSVKLPKSLYKEALPDNPNRVAFKWGPYVLAADYSAPNVRATAADTLAAANSVGGGAGASGSGAPAAASAGASGGRRGAGGGGRRGGAASRYPVFVAKADAPLDNLLKRVPAQASAPVAQTGDATLVFHATGIGGDNNEVDFKPFYQLSGERYGVYQDLYTPEEWQQRNTPAQPTDAAPQPPAASA